MDTEGWEREVRDQKVGRQLLSVLLPIGEVPPRELCNCPECVWDEVDAYWRAVYQGLIR